MFQDANEMNFSYPCPTNKVCGEFLKTHTRHESRKMVFCLCLLLETQHSFLLVTTVLEYSLKSLLL
jgi:hypothetical protein